MQPKVQTHTYSCSASAFNCIDCGRTFNRQTVKVRGAKTVHITGLYTLITVPDRLHAVQDHTSCVTEHDKYAKGATKPGGFAAQGFYGSKEAAKEQQVRICCHS